MDEKRIMPLPQKSTECTRSTYIWSPPSQASVPPVAVVGAKVLIPALEVHEVEVASRHATGEGGQDEGRERGDLHDRDCCADIINQCYLNGSSEGSLVVY